MFKLAKHDFKRKLFFGFKYIRFKSSLVLSPTKVIVKDAFKLRVCKLAEILDCTNHTAQKIISKNKNILTIESKSFIRNAQFCNRYLKFSDIIEFPVLISLNPSLLQHRYFSLLELGCLNITASKILKYLQIIKKTPTMLESEGIYFSCKRNLDHCMPFISDCDSERKLAIKSSIQNMYRDGCSLWKIKEMLNAEILASKLNCSTLKTRQMFQRYPPLQVQSIEITLKLLDVLFQKYKFPVSKTFFSPFILSLHHEIAENFLEEMPHILGVSTVELAQKLPLILRRPIDSVHEMEKILKEYNITDKQLLCCPKVLKFTPRTLQERIEALCNSKTFALLKNYRKFLFLVYNFNRLQPRLEYLKVMDMPCSISMFTVSDCIFDKYLRCSEGRSHISDISHYLAEVLSCSESDVREKLCEFPNMHNSCVTNCYRVLELLLNAGVNKKQLFNGLGIIFYDIDIVKLYFNNLQNHPGCQPFSEWISHYNLMQLLIYIIEVDAGFRGSRLYKAGLRSADSEELSVSGFGF